ncbi:GNAT family N-acetyltransferase [Arthrobacter sp. 24S4-2]|uniref:GNAT family N-acetyltransferase n=1 Tax=Arthrobacter sp. 24S4-2 TaxID=2575374 RepID=UPI0010C7D6C2|nr:GNAT family N-acetyltransferase [Arthrobacter sp. 24S4-2]QCO99966.1 GNAT family N-acetyltransferase [Arthrobacter sp. 24S4-2]
MKSSEAGPAAAAAGWAIRAAEPTDLPMLYRSELQYMREIESDQLERWMQAIDRNLELWTANLPRARVAEADGVPAGIMLWMPLPDDAAVLVTIHVLPEFRRQGFGWLLLEQFISDALSAGTRTLTLGVHLNNPARALYEQAGFVRTHDEDSYLYYALPGAPVPPD